MVLSFYVFAVIAVKPKADRKGSLDDDYILVTNVKQGSIDKEF